MNKIDKYIGFSFNGLSLGLHADADFKGFIVNEGDLSFGAPAEFENEFAERPYGEGSVYLGRTKSNKVWNMKLMLKDVSLNKYREFLVWLNESAVGFLVFDYNKNYGYKAKVDSIGEGLYYPSPNCRSNEDLYFVEIEVGFVSVNGGLAQWVGKEAFAKFEWGSGITGSLIDNEFGVPFLEYEEIGDSTFNITLTNKHNVPNSFTIELFDDDFSILADDGGTEELDFISNNGIFPKKFFAEHGVLINSKGEFEIFNAANDIRKIIIPPNSNRKFIFTFYGKTIIRPTSYEIF